jgi:putative SOS response-associated peptidase YedK
MVITNTNELVADVHDRMPVVLEPDQFEPSLTGRAGMEVLKPAANDLPAIERLSASEPNPQQDAAVSTQHSPCEMCHTKSMGSI